MSDNALAGFPARRKARKRAVDVLYEAEQRDEPIRRVLEDRRKLAVTDPQMPGIPEYTFELVDGVAEYLDEVDDVIARCLHSGWYLDRIAAVDRNILRVAAFELRYREDVDAAVAISEAVKIAEVLCGEDSPAFVNGVLQSVSELEKK
ncbi:transcription antitermination factor NusB [Stackebrandtia nassauensis]|uniref:Transcription antitermination protein NusB n=1 Tax=Stackebrandtia nassauensis (strain DSM 44728 / CIP 108903 / NRRL B-16338 / NBRC 102104 / LLR-40K-21) TaxID=446470 RepID=D3QBD5_STANL|nr:transcription antitermination factor NusB [Stackebrandtia nassauensis]ADD42817.1 NusB antitermination factor [Stackebrandtia nassauensis DSM 44728]